MADRLQVIRKKVEKKRDDSETVGSHLLYKTLGNLIGASEEKKLPIEMQRNVVSKVDVVKDSIILEDKVHDYLVWYKQHMVIGHYTNIGEYHCPIEMQDFIEKMAVWYELRYPDYEINRILPCTGQESTQVSKEMFVNNSYVKDLLDEENDIKHLDWADFYNFEAFYNSLSGEERSYFSNPSYPSLLYYDSSGIGHIHLDRNGKIYDVSGIPFLEDFEYRCDEINIKDVVDYIQNNNIHKGEEFIAAVNRYEDCIKSKEGMLDSVMYRIIERGGNRYGPRRAFLFAQEFGRDISIPLIYGYETSDPGMRKFMNAYLKAGGSPDIVCFVNYFSRSHKYEELECEPMRKMIRTTPDDCVNKYTEEERELQQRLTSILAYQANLKDEGSKWIKHLKKVNVFGK